MANDEQFMYYVGSHPNWQYKGSLKFEHAYKKLVAKRFNPRNEINHRINIGEKKFGSQSCCFCLQKSPDVSFLKEAHAIPACLGNRIYFTNEECDNCNERFGNNYENHLANMTEAERGLFQIPTRGAPPKWTTKGGTKQFQWSDRGIVMTSGGPKDAVKFTIDEENNKIKIEGPMRPFEPIRAIKSVIHSTWLFLTPEQRKKYSYLIDIIDDKIVILPFVYLSGYLSHRAPGVIEFQIYEKKVIDADLPDLVVMLYVGHTLILWSTPNIDKNEYLPFPFPMIKVPVNMPSPAMQTLHINDLGFVSKRKSTNFNLSFDKIEKGPVATNAIATLTKKKSKDALPKKVNLRLTRNSSQNELHEFYMKVKNIGSSDPKIILSKEDEACNFIISLQADDTAKLANLIFNFQPEGKPAKNVINAISFIEGLMSGDGEFHVISLEGENVFSFDEFTPNNLIKLVREKELASKLVELSRHCGNDFLYPKEISDGEITNLLHAVDVFGENLKSTARGNFNLTLTPRMPQDQLNKFLNGEGKLTFENNETQIQIFGTSVTVPRYRLVALSYKINSVSDENGVLKIEGHFLGLKYERLSHLNS